MKKALIILAVGVLLVALALLGRAFWWGRAKPETVVLTAPPTPADVLTVEGLQPPEVKPEWVEKMREYEARAHWLDTPAWITQTVEARGKDVNLAFWQVPLISTGQWGGVTLMTRNGAIYRADVLYTLQLNAAKQVLVVPLVVSVSHEGETIDFLEGESVNAPPSVNDFPLGKAVIAVANAPFATLSGLDWGKCKDTMLTISSPAWVCELGQAIEAQWPGYTALVLRRVLAPQQVPENFVLYGVRAHAILPPPDWRKEVDIDLSTWEVSP